MKGAETSTVASTRSAVSTYLSIATTDPLFTARDLEL